ncbi:membrane protein [Caloranaerobacter azorensis H53214]|uniref:Membrane protein n=1 Tax=Caloranaerobacter azorensis H53214 TaxID=1156417 RepID=A0A096CUX7_9FIRM|nr:HsmA family protein [Caloranaerobacter azorensis]KGG80364.1 membrane protein [Caloranaerobacter azorensis H53214]
MLNFAIIFITSALICYTIGVWSEKIAGILKTWHLVFFWIGFAFDTLGTTLMGKISGGFKFNVHGVTGLIAILLMLFHAVWATIVLLKKDQKSMKNFHKFSLLVWFIWLIPYFTGMVLNMI